MLLCVPGIVDKPRQPSNSCHPPPPGRLEGRNLVLRGDGQTHEAREPQALWHLVLDASRASWLGERSHSIRGFTINELGGNTRVHEHGAPTPKHL